MCALTVTEQDWCVLYASVTIVTMRWNISHACTRN